MNEDSYISNKNSYSTIQLKNKNSIKVSFYSFKETFISQDEYSLDITIKEIIEDFLNKETEKNLMIYLDNGEKFNKNNLTFYYKTKGKLEKIQNQKLIYYYKIKEIENKPLKTSSENSLYNNFTIYVKNGNLYNNISEDMDEYIIANMYLIGKPILNQLKYYLYNKNDNILKIIKYKKEQVKKYNIQRFFRVGAYCNANNKLYIYEGSSDLNSSDNCKFFQINLANNEIRLISSIFPNRFLHSMIFIPKLYIFIIGGKNTKTVLTYTIQDINDMYEKYPYLLPYEMFEPSLILLNSKYLYAFENSTLFFHILRANLVKTGPFEEIQLKNNSYNYNISQKFFGVTKNNNSILFLGGQMLNLSHNKINKCFSYNYVNNTLEISQIEFRPFEFMEKTFLPIRKGLYFQLGEYKKENRYEPKKVLCQEQEITNLSNFLI